MSIPFFIVVIVRIIFSSSQGDCQVTPDLSTQFVTSSDSTSQTDWTKKGSIANVTAGKVFHAWVSKGLSGASAAGIVGWVNSEGGFAMIGRAEGHYGNDLRTNSIAFGVEPIGLSYYTTEAGGGTYQFTPYTKYAPLGDPKWENADAMNEFVAKAILAGDWNASMDLTGGNHTFKQMAQMTDPRQATLVWQAYERGSTAHINPFQKQADAQKAYELFDGAKYSYNEIVFHKSFDIFGPLKPGEGESKEVVLSLCESGSYSKGVFGKDCTGKVNYTSYNASDITLYELWFEWYNLVIKPSNLAETTKNKYFIRGSIIRKLFGNQKVNKIKHSAYQRKLNTYAEKYTKNHVRRLNSDIKKAIQFAKRDGILLSDFTDGVVIAGRQFVKDADDKYLHNISDYKKVISYLENNLDYSNSIVYYLLLVLFKTGLRVGEALALTWDDVNFENLEIKTYRRFSGDKGTFSPPKTKTSIRTIPISQSLGLILKRLKDDQQVMLKNLKIVNINNQIFYDYRYGVSSNSAINKSLRNVLHVLNIDSKMTATGARHTYGSYLLAKGVDIWVVARLIGHKDITQLLETYGHVLTEVINKEYETVRSLVS